MADKYKTGCRGTHGTHLSRTSRSSSGTDSPGRHCGSWRAVRASGHTVRMPRVLLGPRVVAALGVSLVLGHVVIGRVG